jgi:hypothetical protein
MRIFARFFFIMLIIVGSVLAAKSQAPTDTSNHAAPAAAKDSSRLSFYGRLQVLSFLQNLKDAYRDDTRAYLYLKEARVGANAMYDDIEFDLQFALGGEEIVKAPSPGVSLSLLDLSADVPLSSSLRVKAGQFKVPYGRENLVDEGRMLFSEPSIQFMGSKLGRDVGVAFNWTSGTFTSIAGIFTGGGRDVPIRYIPMDLGLPMIVARVGINDGLDDDLYNLKQSMLGTSTGFGAFVNALYTKDSKVGHSTALNVKLDDKSLLLNPNWNPYISRAPLDKSEFWQIGADVAARISGPEKGISGEAEINYGAFKNVYGSLKTLEGRVQGAYFTNPFEFALRYAFLQPDESFAVRASTGVLYPIVDSKLIHEITASISYFPIGNRLRRDGIDRVLHEPVATEPNIGAYPLMEQRIKRPSSPRQLRDDRYQTVVEARISSRWPLMSRRNRAIVKIRYLVEIAVP